MRIARWLGCLVLIAGAPMLLPMLLVWLDHRHSFWPAMGWTAWLPFLAVWSCGVMGIHLLPLRARTRGVIAALYSPVAAGIMFMAALAAMCGWYGACP